MSGAAVRALNEEVQRRGGAQSMVLPWSELAPIAEPTPTLPATFPFDGLGAILGPAARSIAAGVQAPDGLAGASVLAAAALAAQPHADVLLPHGQRAPLSLFILSSAQSGDRKTACDGVASLAIEEVRRAAARAFSNAMRNHETEQARARPGETGRPPRATSLTIGKATVEGLGDLLKYQSHIGLFTSEGGELLGGHSMQAERKAAGMAWLLKAWGAETLDSLTRGNGLSVLLGRRVSMHAMVQPVLLRMLLADPLAKGQGLLARCLIAEPASKAGTRLFNRVDPKAAPAVIAYGKRLSALLELPAPVMDSGDGYELTPRTLRMSDEATELWIAFYNEVEREQADGKALSEARAFASKIAEQAARIAGIVALVNDPRATEIQADELQGAIEVAGFYLNEHLRLTGVSVEALHTQRLRDLADWMRQRGAFVPHADVLQKTPPRLRTLQAAGLGVLLAELVERGYLRRAAEGWEVRRV